MTRRSGPVSIEWNLMVDALRERTPVVGPGHGMTVTPFGHARLPFVGPAHAVPPHPFQIYPHPDDVPGPDDWRKFRVRHGIIFLNWAEVVATGTDNVAAASVLASAATNRFWFWFEISGGAVSVQSSATPPTWSGLHVPIGYVNTQTDGVSIVTQIVTTNLFLCA